MVQISKTAVNRWVARIIPALLIGTAGYVTYVVVAVLCGVFDPGNDGCLGVLKDSG